MLFLFKIGIIEIDIVMIASFLLGILLGAILVCLIYAIIVVASLGSKDFVVKTEDDSLTVLEVKDMVVAAQKSYKDKNLRGDNSRVNHCKNICKDLVYGIATRFYPNSKYPLLELSVDESLKLVGYIQKRIDDILDRKGINLLKKLRISSIVSLTQKTNQVMDSKAYQVGKELSGAVSTIKKVANVFNPAWWFRKLVMDKTMNIILNKLCLIVIAVVGEETYKIYSKTVFNKDVNIETNVDELLESIDMEIIEAREVAKKEVKSEVVVHDPGDLRENHAMYKKRVYTQNKVENNYTSIFDTNAKCKKKNVPAVLELETAEVRG